MATLTIRNLDEKIKADLRIRATLHGQSMGAEVRAILRETLANPTTPAYTSLHSCQGTASAATALLMLKTLRQRPAANPTEVKQRITDLRNEWHD